MRADTLPVSKSREVPSLSMQEGEPVPPFLDDTGPDEMTSVPATGRRLFVGNLPFAWTEEPLRELFALHGTVTSVAIPRLRGRGGRSRGFGFVEMSTRPKLKQPLNNCTRVSQVTVKSSYAWHGREKSVRLWMAPLHPIFYPPRLCRKKVTLPSRTVPGVSRLRLHKLPDRRSASESVRRGIQRPRGRGRSDRGDSRRPPARPGRSPRSQPSSPETVISNNSGYEIYPGNSKGRFDAGTYAPQCGPTFRDRNPVRIRGHRRHRKPWQPSSEAPSALITPEFKSSLIRTF